MLRRTIRVLLLAAFASSTPSFAAQPIYPGGPTVGDINRENFTQLLIARQRAAAAVADFNESLSQARVQFFSTRPGTPEHNAAEKDFAAKLQGKDLFFLDYCVRFGFKDGMARLTGVGILTAGSAGIDRGLPRSALPWFEEWVNAIRKTLGAKSESELLLATFDSDAMTAAINAHLDEYAAYKRARDQAEFTAWALTHPDDTAVSGALPAEETARVKVLLQNQGLYLLRYLPPRVLPVESEVAAKVDPEDQQILICIYGRISTFEWPALFPRKNYWYRTVPNNVAELHRIDRWHGLDATPDKAFETCPETAEESKRQFVKEAKFYGPTNLTFSQEQALYLDNACRSAAMRVLRQEEGPFAAMLREQGQKRYIDACKGDANNLTATKVSADLPRLCTSWNDELAAIRRNRPAPNTGDFARLESYDRQCGGVATAPASAADQQAGSSTASTATERDRAAGAQPQSNTDATDAHARMCKTQFANLATLRAKASGLREMIQLKLTEQSVFRQCGKP